MTKEIVGSVAKMLARAQPILARLPAPPMAPTLVEVGVSSGIMAEHLLRSHPLLEWHGIDPWAGAAEQRPCYVESGDVHARISRQDAEAHMAIAKGRVAPFGGRAFLHRDWSPEAAEGFAPGTATMVFLDADHSFDGVWADLAAWWPIVSPGGWLGGHDYDHPDPRFRFGVKRAVDPWAAIERLPVELDQGLTWFVKKP